ncbi:MAG: FG-GAP-like repeat-containing protein [Planctomycetia bacterium]|nr:FG-GAP-like repeat-containing protein [Planctomycetia bacterium]
MLGRVAFGVVVLLAISAVNAGETPAQFGRSTIASGADGKSNAYPCLARLDDGRLLLVWSPREKEGPTGHYVVGAFSDDHARTWSKPITLIQSPQGQNADPSILVSGNRIFVTATTLPASSGIRVSTTTCTRSDDNGRTWSPVYTIPMNRRYTCGKTHHGLRLKSGTLLLGYSWDVLCERGETLTSEGQMHLRAGVMISTDDGQTWQNGGDTDADYPKTSDGAVLGTDEPAIVELDDGSVLMLARTGSTHLYEARSTDEGRTWTDVKPSPLLGSNAPAALCRFDVAGRRGILCVWDNAVARYPLCAAASFDGGKTWSEPKDVAGPTDGHQASYPSCEQAADGALVEVWQQDTPGGRDVRCARFDLAWLLGDRTNAQQGQGKGKGDSPIFAAVAQSDDAPSSAPRKLGQSPTGGIEIPWTGRGSARILVEVPPRDLGGRPSDEMPARLKIDLADVFQKLGIQGQPDLGRIQVIRYEAGEGKTPADQPPREAPYRFDDFDRREYSFWYNVPGNGHEGQLVWSHRQEGPSPTRYAVYLSASRGGQSHFRGENARRRGNVVLAAKIGTVPGEPGESPIPLLGDCDALWTDQSDGYLITALHCKPTMADFNGDGLLDLLVGEIQGHIFYFENRGTRQQPKFARGRFLMLDDKPLRMTHYTTPRAVDWDDDGDLDLLVGRANDGQIWFVENVGSRAQYKLALRGRVEADGRPIAIPPQLQPGETILTSEYMCMPEVVDFDGDGDKDLLVGGYVSGAIFYFENVKNAKGLPTLAARGPITADGKTLRVGSAASPCVADFDGDGDLDLITALGNAVTGHGDPVGITYFENVGTRTKPDLRQREFPFVKKHHVGAIAVPSAADWDADGDLDLVIGDVSRVRLYRNVGSAREPRFEQAETLANRWGPVQTGAFATAPGDWDGDGDPDLISSVGGRFELKLNQGSGNPPRWTNAGMLLSAGKEIQYVFPPGDPETFPVIVDLNRDGLPDLLQGVASGFVWYYKNVGSRTEPKLAEGVQLRRQNGQPVKIGFYKPGDKATDFATHSGDRSDPKPADFDGDGDLDLMVSDAYGYVTYFENVGGNADPVFAEGVQVLHESNDRALIDVTDWDGDGRVDILLAQGSIWLYRNVGTAKEPKFQRDRAIPHQYIPYPHPYVVDWNADGDQDLLISSSYGVAYLLERSYAEAGYAEAKLTGIQHRPDAAARRGEGR